MDSTFEKEILSMKEEAVPKNTKMATKYLMVSYLISPASYYKAKNQNTMPCLQVPAKVLFVGKKARRDILQSKIAYRYSGSP